MPINKLYIRNLIRDTVFTLLKNPISKLHYQKEIARRALLPSTEIIPLSKRINLFSPISNEIHKPNNWYGHASILKEYAQIPQNYQFKCVIEHGLYLTNQVVGMEMQSPLPSFITYSSHRANVLKKYQRPSFSIGPFIHYTDSFLNKKQLSSEKKRLGQNLLYFPSHSSIGLDIDYDFQWVCKKLKEIGKGFKTIRVCLYWLDVLNGHHKKYQEEGFECVTAGHMLDPMFLPRLKSIIECADLTIANDAGKQVGYCIFMGKPLIIINQPLNLSGSNILKENITKYMKSGPWKEVVDTFSKPSNKITKRQQDIIDKYYGSTADLKTPSQLRQIIEETENIYQRTHEK